MFTISTEAGTVRRRNSSRPPSPARWPDAFLSELEAGDSRVRALDASGALAVISDLLSWVLADDGECQHLILGQESATPPTLNLGLVISAWSENPLVAATSASRMPGSENAWPATGTIVNSASGQA